MQTIDVDKYFKRRRKNVFFILASIPKYRQYAQIMMYLDRGMYTFFTHFFLLAIKGLYLAQISKAVAIKWFCKHND